MEIQAEQRDCCPTGRRTRHDLAHQRGGTMSAAKGRKKRTEQKKNMLLDALLRDAGLLGPNAPHGANIVVRASKIALADLSEEEILRYLKG